MEKQNDIDFAKVAELIFSHREKEITIPNIPLIEYTNPEALFFGQWTGEEWFSDEDTLEPDYEELWDAQFANTLYDALRHGVTCVVNVGDTSPSILLLMAYDALYGVMLQDDAKKPRLERSLNVGKLEFLTDEHDTAILMDFMGSGVIKFLSPILQQKFMHGTSLYAKLYGIVETEVSFFLPVSNIFLTNFTEKEIERYDSFCNYDTHWGGLLGWYRLECIMRMLIPGFELSFQEQDRKELEAIVEDKLLKLRVLYEAVENILTRQGAQFFEQTLSFYESIYARK